MILLRSRRSRRPLCNVRHLSQSLRSGREEVQTSTPLRRPFQGFRTGFVPSYESSLESSTAQPGSLSLRRERKSVEMLSPFPLTPCAEPAITR